MGIIVRYILRELGITFFFGFAAFTCLLLIVVLVREALDRNLPLFYVGQLVPYAFVEVSSISLPVTLLLAVTVFFSRMSGNNEVIALKALGISPSAFLMPVFAIAVTVSLIGIWVNERAVTWGRQGASKLLYRGAEDILLKQLKDEKSFETGDKQLMIFVQGVDEQRRLIEPKIMSKKESATIEAQSAQISIDFNTRTLTLTLVDFRITANGVSYRGGNRTLPISLSNIVPETKNDHPSNMSLQRIDEERQKTTEQIEQQQRIIAAHQTFAASMGTVDVWTAPPIRNAKSKIISLQSYYDRLSVEPPRRWATGFCCFFFVWLGAPLAIWMRKPDFFSSFFACFVPILLLFYPLLMFGLQQAKAGHLPPICVWTANAGIGLIGLWFLRKIYRY